MPIARVQVELPFDSGDAKDVAVNTLYFDSGSVALNSTTGALIYANVIPFYRDVPPGQSAALRQSLSPVLSGLLRMKMYNLSDPTPRIPFFADEESLILTANAPLPNEVSVCLSFQANTQSGQPQRRRRGRIYIGPLNVDALNQVGSSPRPDTDLIGVLMAAAIKLENDSAADLLPWVIHSTVTANAPEVTNGWVDNEFDTQRRRGEGATVRNVWVA